MEQAIPPKGRETQAEAVLSIRELRMKYGDRYVLNGIDLEARQGQIIGYIGPNGAGKSTTIKIMLGLVKGYSGEVKLFGRDLAEAGSEYKRRIGYVPETAELYDNLTAREYLTFTGELYGLAPELAERKARMLMEAFGLSEAIDSRIAAYSKGMKQKVLLSSCLLHDPDLIFLDEPLSGLDANSVMVVKELLELLAARGKTVFYSSHIMDVVEKISSRIVLLSGGRVAADGSFEELRARGGEKSLEELFNQLTDFHEHRQIAERLVGVLEER
ncbi:ABC transporter ATP-binding protein [Saccharibacillus deserti]|uniref:ABC transporter ATP-binding protein n=1 Tax=Saccharibacillus deserti TaxID=1634444 RepID=UPI001552DB29|nr:ABC transporter ATP-binding protein [Saccharibacillus deserti]